MAAILLYDSWRYVLAGRLIGGVAKFRVHVLRSLFFRYNLYHCKTCRNELTAAASKGGVDTAKSIAVIRSYMIHDSHTKATFADLDHAMYLTVCQLAERPSGYIYKT